MGSWAERVDSWKVGAERIVIINLKLQNEKSTEGGEEAEPKNTGFGVRQAGSLGGTHGDFLPFISPVPIPIPSTTLRRFWTQMFFLFPPFLNYRK